MGIFYFLYLRPDYLDIIVGKNKRYFSKLVWTCAYYTWCNISFVSAKKDLCARTGRRSFFISFASRINLHRENSSSVTAPNLHHQHKTKYTTLARRVLVDRKSGVFCFVPPPGVEPRAHGSKPCVISVSLRGQMQPTLSCYNDRYGYCNDNF
jgi:hypothetical protein